MIVFVDESGISERPTRVRTWAPKGQTPIIQFHFNWTHVSVIAGLTRTNCLFRLHEGSIKKEELVDLLKALKTHLKQPLLVIWDGAGRITVISCATTSTAWMGISRLRSCRPTRPTSIRWNICGDVMIYENINSTARPFRRYCRPPRGAANEVSVGVSS